MYLVFMRRFEEATAALKRAEELDPVSIAIATDLGVVHNFARRSDLGRWLDDFAAAMALEMSRDFGVATVNGK